MKNTLLNTYQIQRMILVITFACLVVISLMMILSPTTFADTVSEAHKGINDVGGGTTTSGTVRVKEIISTIVNIILFLIGSFAVIMIVISGFRFVTANGDANTVTQAKNTIIYSVIGIVVAVMAYAIVSFVLGALA